MEDKEIHEMVRKKNELLRRIEEKRRLMELINNPNIKNSLEPIHQMKKNSAVKKIQNFWRRKCQEKQFRENLKNEMKNNIITKTFLIKNKSIMDFTLHVIRLQRAVRRFLKVLSREKFKSLNISEHNKEFFSNIRYDKVNLLKNEVINSIKRMELPNKNTDFQEILNMYFSKYHQYNYDFPNHMRVREDKLNNYYQCLNMVQYMESNYDINS
jgi:hypothetical protein